MKHHICRLIALLLIWHGVQRHVQAGDDVPPGPVYVKIPPTEGYRYGRSVANYPGEGEVVPILKPYFISKGPITNAEYMEFVGATGHAAPSYWPVGGVPEGKERHPVTGVSYQDALDFCNWLDEMSRHWHIRLPTELEWERAACGDSAREYPWGDHAGQSVYGTTLLTQCNFNSVVTLFYLSKIPQQPLLCINPNSPFHKQRFPLKELISILPDGRAAGWQATAERPGFLETDLMAGLLANGGHTVPVNAYMRNVSPFGCHDMVGNVWEWTCTPFGIEGKRFRTIFMVRGGSWADDISVCTCTNRGESRRADSHDGRVGFRVVAVAAKKPPRQRPISSTETGLTKNKAPRFKFGTERDAWRSPARPVKTIRRRK